MELTRADDHWVNSCFAESWLWLNFVSFLGLILASDACYFPVYYGKISLDTYPLYMYKLFFKMKNHPDGSNPSAPICISIALFVISLGSQLIPSLITNQVANLSKNISHSNKPDHISALKLRDERFMRTNNSLRQVFFKRRIQ